MEVLKHMDLLKKKKKELTISSSSNKAKAYIQAYNLHSNSLLGVEKAELVAQIVANVGSADVDFTFFDFFLHVLRTLCPGKPAR